MKHFWEWLYMAICLIPLIVIIGLMLARCSTDIPCEQICVYNVCTCKPEADDG